MEIPSRQEFIKGYENYEKREGRDPIYRVARFLVTHYWGKPRDMADGLGTLLLVWNQAFYRYGHFDMDKLEKCISSNFRTFEKLKERSIFSLCNADEPIIKKLFHQFLKALEIHAGKSKGKRSPVAVSKALHLLAPNFFPLWDDKIAKGYFCRYSKNPAEEYIRFCRIMKIFAEKVKGYTKRPDILKVVDQFNYSKFTKGWI